MKIKVIAYDLEHDGDMDLARRDIAEAGGKILQERQTGDGSQCEFEAYFLVETTDKDAFTKKLEYCEVY